VPARIEDNAAPRSVSEWVPNAQLGGLRPRGAGVAAGRHELATLPSQHPPLGAVLHALRRELNALGAVFGDDLTMALAMCSTAVRRELTADPASLAHVRGLVEQRRVQTGLEPIDDLAPEGSARSNESLLQS
jgi:hypothetical protein